MDFTLSLSAEPHRQSRSSGEYHELYMIGSLRPLQSSVFRFIVSAHNTQSRFSTQAHTSKLEIFAQPQQK